MRHLAWAFSPFLFLGLAACGDSEPAEQPSLDPESAPVSPVDRFGDGAMLQRRADDPTLPGPDEPVDFDSGPFITRGFGPRGNSVRYYNFDVQPTQPGAIYVLQREGESGPVRDQLDIIDALPGEEGYSDFLRVVQVSVPASYVANEVTSREQIEARGYEIAPSDQLVNRPVVPRGSTATLRLDQAPAGAERAWYRGTVAHVFHFDEATLAGEAVPSASIYVSFNLNPGVDGGGPASGFRHEPASEQTHNVLTALPSERGYSPLWSVSVYDEAAFERVVDLPSVLSSDVLANGVANVNCPVVEIDE